jgi:branched-chain amino acid transport system ATP-binding protein
MSTSLLGIEGVSKRFGAVRALEDVSFRVEEGETVGLIGPNGSGKTTLIGAIAGLHRPDAGAILLRGRPIQRLAPHRRRRKGIAQTFQVVRPLAGLSVFQNVVVAALFSRSGVSRESARTRAHEALDAVGLGESRERPVNVLPVQDLKLLELARALAADPQVLLLDEVMAGLSDNAIDALTPLVRSLAASGRAVLMTEHRVRTLFALADRIVVLQEGRKIAEGSPRQIASDPLVISAYLGHGYSAKLLGRSQ